MFPYTKDLYVTLLGEFCYFEAIDFLVSVTRTEYIFNGILGVCLHGHFDLNDLTLILFRAKEFYFELHTFLSCFQTYFGTSSIVTSALG